MKVDAPRKGKSRAYHQEETCPRFGQAEGKGKALVVGREEIATAKGLLNMVPERPG